MEAWRQWPLGGRQKPCSVKLAKDLLDSDRPSHGRQFHQQPRGTCIVGAIAMLRQDALILLEFENKRAGELRYARPTASRSERWNPLTPERRFRPLSEALPNSLIAMTQRSPGKATFSFCRAKLPSIFAFH